MLINLRGMDRLIQIDKVNGICMLNIQKLIEKELKFYPKGTHTFAALFKKPHKNNAVRFTCVLAVGTRFRLVFPL